MSTRASLIYILIGALLAGYVGLHWGLARELDVTVERKWTGETKRRFGRGTAYFIATDQGEFGFFGTPFTADSDEMFAQLTAGDTAGITVIDWLHGPLLAQIMEWESRPLIVEVR
ncbi:MAG: hypothetical protein OEN23_10690 [Paracoccaceae bacterium]|nr:hypothetical protein [Paracoccaceae bacterium]